MKKKHGPGDDQFQLEAVYFAAAQGWYDTSEAAQRVNLLHISVTDLVNIGESTLPEGATHRFFITINDTSCIVTRYHEGHYAVQEYDQVEPHRQERALRKAVMDMALRHFTEYNPDPEAQEEARNEAIQALLEGVEPDQERDGGPVVHAVMNEELPDIFVVLPVMNEELPSIFLEGSEAKSAQRVQRQWRVAIGPNRCEVGLVDYTPDGAPELIARDAEQRTEDGTEDEAGVNVAWTVVKTLYPDAQGEELMKRLKEFQAVLNDQSKEEERQRAYEAFLARKREEPEQP